MTAHDKIKKAMMKHIGDSKANIGSAAQKYAIDMVRRCQEALMIADEKLAWKHFTGLI